MIIAKYIQTLHSLTLTSLKRKLFAFLIIYKENDVMLN